MIYLEMPGLRRIEAIAQGHDYISFSQGALRIGGVDQHIKEYVRQILMSDKADYYGDALGLPLLRQTLARSLSERWRVPVGVDQLMICNGGIGGLAALALTLLEKGDEVLLPEPAWPGYKSVATLAKAESIFVSAFVLEPGAKGLLQWRFDQTILEQAVTDKTKMIILSNPSNPCGSFLKRAQLESLASWCEYKKIYLVVDEVYDDYIYEGEFYSSTPLACSNQYIIRVGSFSKNFGMSGWRVGYVVGHANLIKAMAPVQAMTVSCVTIVSQYAALYALEHPERTVHYATQVEAARDMVVKFFEQLAVLGLVEFAKPAAGFYLYFRTAHVDAQGLIMDILQKTKVALAPGSDFGPLSGVFIRLCFARDLETVSRGLSRLQDYFLGTIGTGLSNGSTAQIRHSI